jgi:RimJ/RimL family protein N-acetyltransferase
MSPLDDTAGDDPIIDAISLRPLTTADLDAVFEQMRDPEAVRMAAFVARDPDDRVLFDRHMHQLLTDPTITVLGVVCGDELVGTVGAFVAEGDLEVTYWVDRAWWGRGVATRALALLLEDVTDRPVHGRVAADNLASRRVLEKAGFRAVGTEVAFASARGAEIEEVVLRLDRPTSG